MKTKNTTHTQQLFFFLCLLAHIIFGSTPSPAAPILQLKADADANVIMDGQSSNDRFGTSVSSAGDFNGDGLEDVIVGAIFADDGVTLNTGRVYIFFGQNSENQASLRANPDADIIINGQGGQFGGAVASAGDFNGDGFDDVIIGASLEDTGKAYIFFGQNSVGQLVLNAQTHANVIISGDGNLGNSVASAGDFNGDGMKDVIVGASDNINPGGGPGNAFIFFGRNPLNQLILDAGSNADVTLNGQNAGDGFGSSVSSAGDFNGDGLDDVIAGAPTDDNNGENSSGSAFIFFGRNPVSLISLDADTNANVILDGQDTQDTFGNAVSSAGDFNGDGLDDVVIGAERDNFNAFLSGKAFIFFGQNPINQLKLRADTNANLVFNGNGSQYQLGISVASAKDFNGDGFDDVIIGARGPNNIGFSKGRAHIFFGQNPPVQLILQADTDADAIFEGQDNSDGFASGRGNLGSAGDFNGDGTPDIIVGAHEDDNNSELTSGSAFIFFSPFASIPNNDIILNLPSGVTALLNDNSSSSILHTDTAETIAVADVDNNGVDDVIASFLAGSGPGGTGGTFISRNQGALILLDSKIAEQIAVGNFDGIGGDDLFLDFGADGLWFSFNNGAVTQLSAESPVTMAVGDLDNSGQDDLVLSLNSAGTVAVKNASVEEILDSAPANVLVLADVDGNGEDDLFASFSAGQGPGGTGGLSVSVNQGALFSLTPLETLNMTSGDFDGSGQDDLLFDFGGATGLQVLFNGTSVSPLGNVPVVAMTSGDVDNNDQDDMILSITGVGTIAFKNLTTIEALDPAVALDLATGNVDGN